MQKSTGILKAFLFFFNIILLLLCFSSCSSQPTSLSAFDTTLFGKNEKTGKYINTRGFKLYYEVYGSGKPLLMIHGNGGSINNFVYQIPCFSKQYKVIVADSRAQGKSVDNSDTLSYEMMTDDLNALLDTLHADSCDVIGWSDGGIEGLLLAMRHPDKVKKLAVTGANLWPDTTAVDPFFYNWATKLTDSLSQLPQTPAVKHDLKLAHLLSYEPHIALAQLHTIKCPTLVIGGDHDILLPKHTMLIAENIPESYLWIVPNSGHSTLIRYKDLFNEVVSDFFKNPYRKIESTERGN